MDGVVEVESLVAELLAELETLGEGERRSEEWPCTGSYALNGTPLLQGSVTGVAGGAPVFSSVAM
jgi:hypothetical protein